MENVFGQLVETAMAWHGGQNSALYSFGSTETIHGEEHRANLLREIRNELCGTMLYGGYVVANRDTISAEEKLALERLDYFVQNAPVNIHLGENIEQVLGTLHICYLCDEFA